MTNKPIEVPPPPGSRIAARLDGASFYDAWQIHCVSAQLPALAYLLHALQRTPRWIEYCMQARNRAGQLVGLKDLGTLSQIDPDKPSDAYQAGDRIGIFTVLANLPDEALVGDSDKHLDVVLSVHLTALSHTMVAITITTVVHVKNLLGQLYMLPVRPMHRLIAPAVLQGLPAALAAAR